MEDAKLAEQMRQRDVIVQVERFLKYAPRGTAPATVAAEARLWAERLRGFDASNESRVRKLLTALKTLEG